MEEFKVSWPNFKNLYEIKDKPFEVKTTDGIKTFQRILYEEKTFEDTSDNPYNSPVQTHCNYYALEKDTNKIYWALFSFSGDSKDDMSIDNRNISFSLTDSININVGERLIDEDPIWILKATFNCPTGEELENTDSGCSKVTIETVNKFKGKVVEVSCYPEDVPTILKEGFRNDFWEIKLKEGNKVLKMDAWFTCLKLIK